MLHIDKEVRKKIVRAKEKGHGLWKYAELWALPEKKTVKGRKTECNAESLVFTPTGRKEAH